MSAAVSQMLVATRAAPSRWNARSAVDTKPFCLPTGVGRRISAIVAPSEVFPPRWLGGKLSGEGGQYATVPYVVDGRGSEQACWNKAVETVAAFTGGGAQPRSSSVKLKATIRTRRWIA